VKWVLLAWLGGSALVGILMVGSVVRGWLKDREDNDGQEGEKHEA
jgi:hypothetical protein